MKGPMMNELYKKIRYNLFAAMPKSRESDQKIKDYIRKVRYNLFGRIPVLGRRSSQGETTKSHERRAREGFFERYCQGSGIDIGYAGDSVVPDVKGWDFEHGDAQYMNGIDDESFDFVYSSHLLEHLPDMEAALTNWDRILKPGGYLILYLPHRDLYEKKKTLPSLFNTDHVRFFMPKEDEAPDTVGVEALVKRKFPEHELIYCRTCDEGYVNPGDELPSEGEFSIEVVLKKPLHA